MTGATSGIGRSVAAKLAAAGASVMLCGRRQTEGSAVVDAIRSAGGRAAFLVADVAREADVIGMIDETIRQFGSLDLAHNNAGIEGQVGPLDEQRVEVFDEVMAVNLRGVFLCMKYEIRQMLP